jgi:hypothetical protein
MSGCAQRMIHRKRSGVLWGIERRLFVPRASLGLAVTFFIRSWTSLRLIRSSVNCTGHISPSSSATESRSACSLIRHSFFGP